MGEKMRETTLMEYRFMDEHDRMKLIRDGDFDRYFNLLDVSIAESERIARCLMYAAYLHGCILITKTGNGNVWYLHRSAKYGNDLQLTTWDEYGAVSDVRVRSVSDIYDIMNGKISVRTVKKMLTQ